MKTKKIKEKKEGGAIPLEELSDYDFNRELAEFRRKMPTEAAGFSGDITEKAFRRLYNWVVSCEPLIDLSDVAEEFIMEYFPEEHTAH